MEPEQLRAQALAALDDTCIQMSSPAWAALIPPGDPEEMRSRRELFRAQQARLRLANAILTDIAARLKANAADLESGKACVEAQLALLADATTVLNAISGFVDVVARVTDLARVSAGG
jgi:hypothetical protein